MSVELNVSFALKRHTWPHQQSVTLLGDAAQIMPPDGNRANLAMRDGIDLACALAEDGNSLAAITRYETAMFERATKSAQIASAVLLKASSEDRLALIQKAMSQVDQFC